MSNISLDVQKRGFTIVELLIVIVVIAILATITIVTFSGIEDRARASTIASDLAAAAKQLRVDQVNTGSFPATVAAADEGRGLKASSGTSYTYTVDNNATPQTFSLLGGNGTHYALVTDNSSPRPNLAKGATSPSAILTDGAIATASYYSMGAGLQSVTINLGSVRDLTAVRVWHYYADGRTYSATKTEVSDDGTTWTTIFDSAVSGLYAENAIGRTSSVPSGHARYIRDWINGSTSNTSNHWVEIQAF